MKHPWNPFINTRVELKPMRLGNVRRAGCNQRNIGESLGPKQSFWSLRFGKEKMGLKKEGPPYFFFRRQRNQFWWSLIWPVPALKHRKTSSLFSLKFGVFSGWWNLFWWPGVSESFKWKDFFCSESSQVLLSLWQLLNYDYCNKDLTITTLGYHVIFGKYHCELESSATEGCLPKICGVSSHSQDAVQIHVSENMPETQNRKDFLWKLFGKGSKDVKMQNVHRKIVKQVHFL